LGVKAGLLGRTRNYKESIALYKKALTLLPSESIEFIGYMHRGIGLIFIELKDWIAAKEHHKKALASYTILGYKKVLLGNMQILDLSNID